ncbi:esterase/lipase family protein [Rhodococcus koreensis]
MTGAPLQGTAAPGDLLYFTDPARAAIDYALLAYTAPLLAAFPRGDTHPVLVLPRLNGSDTSTATVHTVLRVLGYRTHGWRLGRNIGPTSKAVHGMRARLDYLTNRYQQPVTLIGWSLGGIYARQLARRTPQAVRQVITLGSPIRLARHDQSRANRLFHRHSHQHIEPLDLPLERDEGPLPVPATSIYTPLDGIVAWRTCLDEPGPRAENIAVLASHLGIASHPAALWAVADRLAQPADSWMPFRPPSLLRMSYPAPESRS